MTTLTFTRASGNVPVVDADSGAVLGDHFLPLFLRGSFELAGIAALKEGEPKLLFTPPEIVFINRICALVKPEEGRTPEAPDLENGPYAPMEQTIVFAQGGVPMGRISSISVDQKTGAPACFSVEPLGPGEAVKAAPAKEEETVCSEPEVCEEPKDEAPAVETEVCEEPETEAPAVEPEVCEEPETEAPAVEPEICEEPETEAPVVEPEVCEEPETVVPVAEPEICVEPETEAPEAPAEPEAPAAEALPEDAEKPAEEPEAGPDDDPDSLPTIDWLLAGRDKLKTPTGLSIDLAMDEDHARYEKALTEAPAPAEEGADPLSYEAYYEDTTPEQFLKKLEGLLSPTAFEKSEIPDPPQMIDSVLFEPDVVPCIATAEKTGEPLPEGRLADIAELLAEKYEARPASEAPRAEEPEKAPAAPEEPAETAAEPAAEEVHEPVIEAVTELAEEAAETAAEEADAPSAEQEASETSDAAPAPEAPEAAANTKDHDAEPEAPETAPADEAPAKEEPEASAPAAKSSDVTFRNTASYRPEEFNLNAPEDYYRPNVNYTKQLQKRNGSQILGMLLFCGACLLMSML
ncbi:MAG: hypothetical protein IJM11_08505 [Firmicutes bacterium]|nr:hypothetical protein [Bacillota bacterium]